MNRFERTVLCGVPIGLIVAELAERALGGSARPLAMLSPFAAFPLFTAAALGITACTMRRRDLVPVLLRLALPLGVCLSVFGLELTKSHIYRPYDTFF